MKQIFGYPIHRQQQTNWCWAAVACGVEEHYGSVKSSQCTLANKELGQTDCCRNGGASHCDKQWYLHKVLGSLSHLDYESSGRISIRQIEDEIDDDEPVGIHIKWASKSGGHFCTIVGGGVGTDGTDYVEVDDPHYGRSIVPDVDLNGFYRKCGLWDWTYRTT